MIRRFTLCSIAGAALALLVTAVAAQTPPSDRELRIYAGLHAAAATGNVAEIEQLVAAGEKTDIQDSHSRTPLLVAAYQHKTEAARALLRLGANPNARDADAFDLLAIAAFNNDLDLLNAALAAGADPRSITGSDDGSALITAARLGHVAIVQALIEAKALIDHADVRGWTAVTTAVVLGNGDKAHKDAIEALVKAGADVDFKDRSGKTALDYARQRGYSEIVPILQRASGRHT